VEQFIGRPEFPRAERGADGEYILWLDEGVRQPLMDRLAADLNGHLAHAAAAGVDVLVLGPATMAEVFRLPSVEAAELLDHVHVEYAAAQRAHPDRAVALAALPMQDPSLALKVLDHAVSELDLRGVSLLTTIDSGRPMITEDSLRVFGRIAEMGVPLVLHPGFRSATRFGTRTIREDAGLSWVYQTSLTALRLIDEGVSTRSPISSSCIRISAECFLTLPSASASSAGAGPSTRSSTTSRPTSSLTPRPAIPATGPAGA